jgi:hypothetical protein
MMHFNIILSSLSTFHKYRDESKSLECYRKITILIDPDV